MCETVKGEDIIESPEICQQEHLTKRAEELCGCVEEITALVMQMPTDVLATPEGTDFFESASCLTASLQKKISIITRETSFRVQD